MSFTPEQYDKKFASMCKNAHRDENGCLLWKGALNPGGYGSCGGMKKGSAQGVHIVSYRIKHRLSSIEKGLHVRHGKNCPRHCFEPSHLQLGTAADNGQDRIEHGRSNPGERNPRASISDETAKAIWNERNTPNSYVKIAAKFKVKVGLVQAIIHGRSWNTVTGLIAPKGKTKSTKAALQRIITEPAVKAKLFGVLISNTVIDSDGCYVWTKGVGLSGYANVSVGACYTPAHVAAWVAEHNQMVPDGMHVCHSCVKKRHCVNPAHLSIGTPTDNNLHQKRDGTMLIGEKHRNAVISDEIAIKIILSKGIGTTKERSIRYGVSISLVKAIDQQRSWKHLSRNRDDYDYDEEQRPIKRIKI